MPAVGLALLGATILAGEVALGIRPRVG